MTFGFSQRANMCATGKPAVSSAFVTRTSRSIAWAPGSSGPGGFRAEGRPGGFRGKPSFGGAGASSDAPRRFKPAGEGGYPSSDAGASKSRFKPDGTPKSFSDGGKRPFKPKPGERGPKKPGPR